MTEEPPHNGPGGPGETPAPGFPGYKLLEKVGQGAFGTVYRALDEKLDRQVAVKVLLTDGRIEPRARERFLAEARALARIRHPNVLAIHAVLEDEATGSIALVTEFIDGATLSEIIEEGGPMGAGEAARVGVELCRALAAVHAAGLVHRDVKTLNVLRERGGRIVLTDFGLGVFLEGGGPVEPGHMIAGSPLFMAPEQIRGEGVSPSTDIYTLGVLLYNLSTGKFPVTTFNLRELFAAITAGHLRPIRDARPDLPGGFVQAVTRALAVDPRQRYRTAGDMEQALLALLGAAPAPVPGGVDAAPPPEAEARQGPPSSRRRLAVAALAITATLAAFAVAFFVTQGSSPGPLEDAAFWLDLEAGPRLARDGDKVAVGSALYYQFQSRRSIHLYVLNEDERGMVRILFPRRAAEPRNPLPPGRIHRLPSADESWEVSIQGGKEMLLVVASTEHQLVLEEAARRERLEGGEAELSYPQLSSDEMSGVLRGFGKVTRRRAADERSARSLVSGFIEELRASGELSVSQPGAWLGDGVWVMAITLANP